jgi:LmbE family N-acetylglucosaminyl deacetylase
MTPTLLAVLAHPDDETLGFGGTLAHYAARGVRVALITATRGDRGRFNGIRPGAEGHPGRDALAATREAELRAAAATLGIADVTVLDYGDQCLDRADPRDVTSVIACHVRRLRPAVVVTFGPDGAYGHPDHIAISQFTSAALVVAADAAQTLASADRPLAPHAVSKFYVQAWPAATYDAYQHAFGTLMSTVDGVERFATPWPDWAVTTTLDTRHVAPTVWRAVQCHASQVAATERLHHLPPDTRDALWSWQYFYRVFSTVSGGRARETDLFEGV